MCFVLSENLLDSAPSMQLLLSLKTLQKTSGFGRCISKINDTSFINSIKSITSRIGWFKFIYSAFVVIKVIYVCNLLYHNNGNPAYVITYPVHNMTFFYYLRHLVPIHWQTRNLLTLGYFFCIWPVNYAVCV